jgi:hypothetical protein
LAFDAWLKTDPFNKPNPCAGPAWMPEYHNTLLERSEELNQKATDVFAEGNEARQIANNYVRVTVILATVLFLIALAHGTTFQGEKSASRFIHGGGCAPGLRAGLGGNVPAAVAIGLTNPVVGDAASVVARPKRVAHGQRQISITVSNQHPRLADRTIAKVGPPRNPR